MPTAQKYIVGESGQKTSVFVPVKVWEDLNANYEKLQKQNVRFKLSQRGITRS